MTKKRYRLFTRYTFYKLGWCSFCPSRMDLFEYKKKLKGKCKKCGSKVKGKPISMCSKRELKKTRGI